jgi:hypothetical protein
MHIPSILPAANIETIDLRNPKVSKAILRKKILGNVIANLNVPNCSACENLKKNTNKRAAFVYAREPALSKYLDKQLHERNIYRISEDESGEEKRICKICQLLRIADLAFVEISMSDHNSLIILGMSKAIGIRILPISADIYNEKFFPWAQESVTYHLDYIAERLDSPVAKFIGR